MGGNCAQYNHVFYDTHCDSSIIIVAPKIRVKVSILLNVYFLFKSSVSLSSYYLFSWTCHMVRTCLWPWPLAQCKPICNRCDGQILTPALLFPCVLGPGKSSGSIHVCERNSADFAFENARAPSVKLEGRKAECLPIYNFAWSLLPTRM